MLNHFLFTLLAIFWGGSFIAIKFLIEDISPFTGAFYRVFFALIFLSLFYIRKLRFKWEKGIMKEIGLSLFTGIVSIGLPFSLLFWGENYIAPSIAGLLNGTVPFWTTLIAIFIFKHEQKLTKIKTLGLFLGFLGISFIFGPKIKMQGQIHEIYGLIAITIMAISYAIGINLNRKYLMYNKLITTEQNLILQHLSSSVYLGILIYFVDWPLQFDLLLKPTNFLSIIYLSLFSTCIAFIIFFKLIKEVGPIKASSVTFFVPAIAVILDIVINDGYLSKYEAVGAAIIFVSMRLLGNKKIKNQ